MGNASVGDHDYGAGSFDHGNSDLEFVHCTITGNSGGIRSWNRSGGFSMTSCIFTDNGPDNELLARREPIVTYTNVQGGFVGEGNIDEDPLFADAANGDFHLADGSPCIDTATDVGAPAVDFEGDPRPIGNGYDMGADEFGGGGVPCDLEVALSNYPASVVRGGRLAFTASVTNGCDDDLTFDRAVMNITGPASLEKDLYNGAPFTVVGSVTKDLSFGVHPGAPFGTYTIEVTTYRDGAAIDADVFDVDITG